MSLYNDLAMEDFVADMGDSATGITTENKANAVIYAVVSTVPDITHEDLSFLARNRFISEEQAKGIYATTEGAFIPKSVKDSTTAITDKVSIAIAKESGDVLFTELAKITERRMNLVNQIRTKYSAETTDILTKFKSSLKSVDNPNTQKLLGKINKHTTL